MTASLEKIVRPFSVDDVFSPRQAGIAQPAIVPSDQEPPIFKIEGKNDGNIITTEVSGGFKITEEWAEDKSRRVTEKVRIENPNDSSQYVITERINQMVFKNTKTSEELPLKMDWLNT